jgi:O-acetyl-ADP-ribose deacetylase (regulator of RNase III)
MGRGIAFEFRLRYPEMYKRYVELCKNREIGIGRLWIYDVKGKSVKDKSKILCFPTKRDWKFPTKTEYIEHGLQKFVDTYREKGITSIAFPLLGAQNGGLSSDESLEIMERYFKACGDDIEIEAWRYDPTAEDDLFNKFAAMIQNFNDQDIADAMKESDEKRIGKDKIRKIRNAIERPDIKSINRLLTINGIGEKTLEKVFHFVMHSKNNSNLLTYAENIQ